jgi:RNA polymerase sigma-70 factor (ECF subfamily)
VDRLYRAAIGLCGSHADAEDLVQETFVAVLRRPRLLRSDDDIGYLLRVLRNTFYSRYRAENRRPRTADLGEHQELPEPRPGAAPEAMAASREVLAAVAALPGLSYREAARALGTREGTIMSRLHRGRAHVAKMLGYTS